MSVSSERDMVGSPSSIRHLKSRESVDKRRKHSVPSRKSSDALSSESPRLHGSGKYSRVSSIRSGVSGADDNDRVLGLIGRLRDLSAYEDVSPPKIVVIGNQTSGKSSVLEGLTGLCFPVSRTQCTRFAIQVTLRHSPDEFPSVKAYIVPGRTSTLFGCSTNTLIRSTKFISESAFGSTDFANIIEKAAKKMGVFPANLSQRYSDDLLKIDISGPGYEDICVVDLPGLCHNPTIFQTLEDINMIRGITSEFINDPRNLIISVMDATNNFSTQDAFHMANDADPTGIRTIGVITKCDVIQPDDQEEIVALAQNRVEFLPHGWFVVKNRSRIDVDSGVTHEQRVASEREFFSNPPWDALLEYSIGIESLKAFIYELSQEHAHRDLIGLFQQIHHVTEEIETTINPNEAPPVVEKANRAVERLGGPLDVTEEAHGEKEVPISELSETEITPQHNEKTGELYQFSAASGEDGLDIESGRGKERPILLINSMMVSCTIILTLALMGLGTRALAQQVMVDGSYLRLALIAVIPPEIFISLFFAHSIMGNLAQIFGPVSQMEKNSKFYSAVASPRLNPKDGPLPHVTIQCPVYKESLESVIRPTVESIEAAMRTYESQGGTVNLFYNDDGMQLISPEQQKERRAFYTEHNIGWVARPGHNENPKEGEIRFIRKGKFKKASNMNYAFMVSNKVEEKLSIVERNADWTVGDEEEAYERCLAEVLEEEEGRAWADGNIRVGDYVLLVDSDTRIPKDCLLDAVSEMELDQQVGIIQFSSGVMNVTTSYFEKGITFFTHLIYSAIRFTVSGGDVSPFVGHNAILRWSALQDTSFHDEDNDYEKFWSESHVSEDFDMALRLQTTGYIIRLATYMNDDFKEGVSLTVYDELGRWEKYAYGCDELLFNPLKTWWRKGPFTPLFRTFIFSSIPIGSKFSMLAYIGTYYAIGFAWISTLMNYFLMGWIVGQLDHFYVNSFEIYLAIIVVFTFLGNISLAVLRYRVEGRTLLGALGENFKWMPLLYIFLGGISLHVSQALLCHLLSIDMSWGATSKEVEDTTFFAELPRLLYRFKYTFIFCISCTVLLIVVAEVVPPFWRIDFFSAIWPLVTVVASHLFLPVLLNPALMKFTW